MTDKQMISSGLKIIGLAFPLLILIFILFLIFPTFAMILLLFEGIMVLGGIFLIIAGFFREEQKESSNTL